MVVCGAFIAAPLWSGAKAQPALTERAVDALVTVESVDQATRVVHLRGPDGRQVTVVAGPEIKRLAEISAGDRIRIHYQEAIAVQLAEAGGPAAPTSAVAGISRAISGQPAGAATQEVRLRVRVEAIDRDTNTVTVAGPNQERRVLTVRDPAMIDFLRRVEVGNDVDVTFREAIALSVEPAG
jgi:hypothetical protein